MRRAAVGHVGHVVPRAAERVTHDDANVRVVLYQQNPKQRRTSRTQS